MKRIGFMAGITAAATAALCLNLNGVSILAVIITLAAGTAGLAVFGRKTGFFKPCLLVLLTALLFCGRYALFERFTVEPVRLLDGMRSSGRILITDVEGGDGQSRITGKVTESGKGMPKNFKIRFYMQDSGASLIPGDSVDAELYYRAVTERYRRSDDAAGIYIQCGVSNIKKATHKNTVAYALWKMRNFVKGRLFEHLPYDEASLINGLLLSDTSKMKPAVYESLRRCGLLHLTAVSGMHLSVFCFGIYGFLRKMLNRRKSALITMPFVFLVMGLAGFTASVVRAGIMALIMLFGNAVFRRSDSLNSLGLAAAAMLMWNPNAILGAGFALSFLAMAGMLIVVPHISKVVPEPHFRFRFLNAVLSYILSSLVCTVSAVLCTAPASILLFGEFSLLSPVLCLLCTAPAMLAMMLGAAAVFLPFLFYPARLPLWLLLRVTAWCSKLPIASVNASPRFIKPWIAAVLVLAGTALLLRVRRPLFCAALAAVLLLVSALGFRLFDRGVVHIAVSNTYGGMAVLIVKDRSCVTIGAGGDESETQTKGYCSGLSVNSHPCALFPSVDGKYFSDGVWDYENYAEILLPEAEIGLRKSLESVGKKVLPLGNMEIEPFEGLRLTVIPCDGGYTVKWECGGVSGAIFTGINRAPKELGKVDYIISDAAPPANFKSGKTALLMAGDLAQSADEIAKATASGAETFLIEPGQTAELLIRNGNSSKLQLVS